MFSVNIDVHESVPQSSVEITNSNRASVCLITKKKSHRSMKMHVRADKSHRDWI